MAHTGNKTKFWRKMASKVDGQRNGRKLRDAMRQWERNGVLTNVHIKLFGLAGIETPVYNKQMEDMKPKATSPSDTDNIEDAVIISEPQGGTASATI